MRKLLTAAAIAAASLMSPNLATASTLTVNGAWDQADEFMTAPAFFNETWDFVCTSACKLLVSDWAVISDMYDVWNGANLLGTTSLASSWDALGCASSQDAACYTADADAAWADSRYSKGIFALAAGAYVISIQTLFIPPVTSGGSPYPDSTVQLKVISAVPLPAGISLLLAGLGGLGLMKRRRSAPPAV